MMTTGSRTEKIVYDGDTLTGDITEWLRYEMEGLNHLRIDERYDSPGDANSVIDDNDPWRVQRVYYNGPGQLGQIVKATVWDYTSTPTATDYYYGYDILGNVSVISNNSGAEVDQFEQDAFGNEVESSWSGGVGSIITERLTTKQYYADLGLYYFNARWYDPSIGLFPNRDTIPVLSHSRTYRFCESNPNSYVDPTGMEAVDCTCVGKIYLIRGPMRGFERVADTAQSIAIRGFSQLYPNATIETLSNPTFKQVDDAFHGSDTLGISVFAHGNIGYFAYANHSYYLASEVDSSKSDLQFYVGMHCYSGNADPTLPGSVGPPFCSQTNAPVCRTHKGLLAIHGAKGLLYKAFYDIAKACDKPIPSVD